MMFDFYQLRSPDTIKSQPFRPGAIYICTDNRHVYFDSNIKNERVILSNFIIFNTEDERLACTPSVYVIYFVTETQKFYTYSADGEWVTSTDTTLGIEGRAADAKAVGVAIEAAIELANRYAEEKKAEIKYELDEKTERLSTEVLKAATDHTDEAINALTDSTDLRFREVDINITNFNKRLNEMRGNPPDGLANLEQIAYKAQSAATNAAENSIKIENIIKNIEAGGSNIITSPEPPADGITNVWIDTAGEHAYLKYKDTESGEWVTIAGGEGSVGGEDPNAPMDTGNIFIGPEAPTDETCTTWIDTSGEYAFLKYKDAETGEWTSIAGGSGSSTSAHNCVHIGKEPPAKKEVTLWVDTSREVAFVKYRNDKNEWVTVSGGGTGGSTGGTTNSAKMVVTNTGGWLSKTISFGSKCIIKLNWTSIEEGLSTGPGTCSITAGGTVRKVYEVQQGDIEVDVTSYLATGTNDIQVGVSDMYGNQRVIKFNITTVAISISSYFNGTASYTGDIAYTYVPVGDLEKTVHFILNGEELPNQIVTASNREQSYMLTSANRDHGRYSLEVYFDGMIDGQPVESNHLYYEFAWYEPENTDPIITIPYNTLTAQQYQTIPFTWQVRGYTETVDVELLKDGEVVTTLNDVDRKLQTWSYRAYEYGEITLGIRCGKVLVEKTIAVTKSAIDVSAETNSLELFLSSRNRHNAEANPDVWENNGISAQMTGFNWSGNGWVNDADNNTVLRLNGDARVYIPFNIFGGDLRTTGKTIEIEFCTKDVLNYDAQIISCMDGTRGINITTQKATLTSEQSEVFTQYKEEEPVRISFTIEKRSENRFLAIYINGILSGLKRYPDNDNFAQTNPVGISIGSSECTTDIYSIRVYNTSLTRYQIVDNWIADTQNIDLMLDRYERNNIFDAYGNITIDKLPKDLPYMILYVKDYSMLPQYKGDKKTVSGKYVDPLHPELSISWQNAQMNVQGTSSQFYSRKNYKLNFKKGLTYTSTGEAASLYALRENSIPTYEFCLKADVASSEGCNNVELVDLYNDIYNGAFPPRDSDTRARLGIEGYPIVIFYGEENGEMTFLGKYNFNNDKGTGEVYGLGDDDQSWEITDNASDMVMWKSDDYFTLVDDGDGGLIPRWKNAFEARHPEDSEEIEELHQLATWLASTYYMTSTGTPDHSLSSDEVARRKQKFIDEFENWFDKPGMIFSYIFTEMFLMVDNRAKNAFPTKYGENNKWIIIPYDYDTALGISNTGELKFSYNLEDIDLVEGSNVFNGQDSVLYANMRDCFFDEIRTAYQDLRAQEPQFSYESVSKRFRDHQSVWGESIFNEDAKFKYIDPTVNEGASIYLPMVQGSKEEQRKWWLFNRFRYMDSKYSAADAMSDNILLRNYDAHDITITPYADIYTAVRFDTIVKTLRAERGKPTTLEDPRVVTGSGQEMVTAIYSASQISDVGDLSGLQCGRVEFANAKRLRTLKLGDISPDYENLHLKELVFENLPLLRTIDLSNCKEFEQNVDFTNCPNIEHIYMEGTKISGIVLPEGGIVKTLHLPATVRSIKIVNQMQLNDLKMPNYENLETIWLEKVDWNTFDADSIIGDLKDGTYVRLTGVDWTIPTVTEIHASMDNLDRFHGIAEDGSRPDKAVVGGIIHTGHVTGDEKMALYLRYPNLEIDWTTFEAVVNFYIDGNHVHGPITVENYGACEDPIEMGLVEVPTKEEDDIGRYIYDGWSEDISKVEWNYECEPSFRLDPKYYVTLIDENGSIIPVNGKDKNFYYTTEGENRVVFPAPEDVPEIHVTRDGIDYIHRFDHWENSIGETITEYIIEGGRNTDIKIYAKYKEFRVYVTKFMNGDVEHNIQYKCVDERLEMPENPTKASTYWLDYHFDGWSYDGKTVVEVSLNAKEQDVTYYAVYHSTDVYHTLAFVNDGVDLFRKEDMQYGNAIVKPENPTKASDNYLHYKFIGWSLDGETIVDVLSNVGETDLIYVALYESSTRYYTVNFYQEDELLHTTQVTYKQDALYDAIPVHPEDWTFVGWEPSNLEVTEDRNCQAKFVYFMTHRFLRRTLLEVQSDESVIANYAFYGCADMTVLDMPYAMSIGSSGCEGCTSLVDVRLPELDTITIGAFKSCTSLENLTLPKIVSVASSSFTSCTSLKRLDLGPTISTITSGAFNRCTALETLIIRNPEYVCSISNITLNDTVIINSATAGYVYVPKAMIESYGIDPNWEKVTTAGKFRAIEDYPEICEEV